MIEITALNIYPVKSLRGIAVHKTVMNAAGLAFDRHWMIVDEQGHFITQRQIPAMASIGVTLDKDALILTQGQATPLSIPFAFSGNTAGIDVTVWRSDCRALDEGIEASRWLTAISLSTDKIG